MLGKPLFCPGRWQNTAGGMMRSGQTGDTLFGYYECDDLKTALAVQKDVPVSARWRAYMRDVIRMEQDPKSGAQPHLEQVFFFGGH